MNISVTSKEAIMAVCRNIVASKGLNALNMRAVADECNIALGTLYNYFSDKDELLIATVESVWKDIFHGNMIRNPENRQSFPAYVGDLFACIQRGTEAYPNFFTAHSISIAQEKKGEAKSTMAHYFAHMKNGMSDILKNDKNVSDHAFSASFTESDFIDFILDNLFLLFVQGKTNCDALMEIIRRTIY